MKFLGAGAYGNVYSAFDMKRNMQVVIKKISKERIPLEELRAEVNILKHLQQSCDINILCYIDFKEDNQFYYIITEYLNKYIDLFLFIEKYCPIGEEKLVKLITNLLIGLKEIHKRDVAHRDIKPENILVNPKTLEIKYIDFGLSCLKICKHLVGTEEFIAPEIILEEIGEYHDIPLDLQGWMKADYWSLGMTIFEILIQTTMVNYYTNQLKSSSTTNLMGELSRSGMNPRITHQVYENLHLKPKTTQFLITHVDPLVKGIKERELVI
jgi:calcium-dependent protein kinase